MYNTTIKKTEKDKNKIVIQLDNKLRIADEKEMQMFLHLKRKGSSMTKNKKKYTRKEKHHKGYM